MRFRASPLQRLADPLPATRLVVHRPRQEGSCRVGQFGDDTDQLAVKIVRPPLPADRDIPGADDLGTLIIRYPYVGQVPVFSPWVSSPSAASVPASRASTSPTVRSRAVGSGSGRWTWMR